MSNETQLESYSFASTAERINSSRIQNLFRWLDKIGEAAFIAGFGAMLMEGMYIDNHPGVVLNALSLEVPLFTLAGGAVVSVFSRLGLRFMGKK